MRSIHDLETPVVLVDLDVLERNIARMAERARTLGVRLRPHAKTHKVVEVGRRQIAAGATGLSVAKTSEAEVFVGADKARRLLALAERLRRLAVGVDSVEGASTLASAFRAAGRTLDVVLKID